MKCAQRGVVVLGSPVGHPAFVQAWAEDRLRAEQELLDQLPKLPDLQRAWLLLLLCASPRANHAIRTMPPSACATYARGHDDAESMHVMHLHIYVYIDTHIYVDVCRYLYFVIALLMLIVVAVGNTVATAVAHDIVIVVVALVPSLDIVTVVWSYDCDCY